MQPMQWLNPNPTWKRKRLLRPGVNGGETGLRASRYLRTILPAAAQLLANADIAAFALDPQRLWICDSTLEASEPHMVERSEGFCSVLIAAKRHAGGVAITILADSVRRAKHNVDFIINILKRRRTECLTTVERLL